MGIEDHINNQVEATRTFEVAHKEKLAHKKSRDLYRDHQCYNCHGWGHRQVDCPHGSDAAWWAYGAEWDDGSWQQGGYDGSWVNFEIWNNQEGAGDKPSLLKKLLFETREKAVLDCGATRCVAGVEALDNLQWALAQEGVTVRCCPEERHRVRFGDNKTLTTTGTVYVPWSFGGVDIEVAIGVLPDSPMPILLCKKVMKQMKLITDFSNNTITTPELRQEGKELHIKESCTGHLMMPMTKRTWNQDISENVAGDVLAQVQVEVSSEINAKSETRSPQDMDNEKTSTKKRTELCP